MEQTPKGVNWSDSQCNFKLEGSSYQKSEAPVGITSAKTELYLEGICQYCYNTQLHEEKREGLLRPGGPMSFCVPATIGQTVGWSRSVSARHPTPLFVGISQNPVEWTEDLSMFIHLSNLLKNSLDLFFVV